MNKKRIALILSDDYPVPAVRGGAIEELVTILVEENEKWQQVEFVVFSTENEKAQKIAQAYQYTEVVYLPKASTMDRIINRIYRLLNKILPGKTKIDIAFYRRAFAYLKQHPVDAIVAEGGKYQELRRFSEEYGKEKTWLHIHHHLLSEPAFEGIYGNVIGISEFAKNEWLRTTADKDISAYTVYNCVNEEKFNKCISEEERGELRAKYGYRAEDTVVLYCGRIQEVKGVRELMQAILRMEDPNIRLLVIGAAGSGGNTVTPYVSEIQNLADDNQERIQFTGYIENTELYKYYQSADIQVIPSLWEEAAGLITIEGMLSGLPLIITKSGGMVEYAPQDVAIQVDRDGVVDNLAEAIERLAKDPALRAQMREKSLERAKAFPKKKFYEDFVGVFEKEV